MLVRVRRLLSSPRRRRRVVRGLLVLVTAGCAVAVGLHWSNTGSEEAKFSPGKPQVTHEEPPAKPLTRADLRSSEKTLDEFVSTAVLRRHLDQSYDLVTGNLRGGLNRDQWRKGEIPVIPFPARDFAFAKSKLRYSYGNFARYDVLIWAKPHASTATTTFSMELKAIGTGKSRHWLVDYFEPLGGGISQPANPGRSPLAASTPERSATKAALGIQWVLVPLSIFALVLLIPIGLAIRGWRRNRRADRDYSRTLPPLPPTSS
jgi:hypothetical protein